MVQLYLLFLSYILKLVNDMNVEFQSSCSKIVSVLPRITELYKIILKNFIKKDVITKMNFSQIDPSNPNNFLPLNEIYVGARANNLILQGRITDNEVHNFRLRTLEFYNVLCKEIKGRFQFDSKILNYQYSIQKNSKKSIQNINK